MSTLITFALFVIALPFVAAALYLALLALLALLPTRPSQRAARSLRRFVLLIPARNEASRLPALAASIRALNYPPRLVSVLIVADNCTDDTAEVARAVGFHVYERTDDTQIGKGYALAYGLAQITEPYDAVVFIDGDCTVSASMLQAFNQRLDGGAEAVQAYYTMRADGESSTQAARGLALALVHLVRPLGKQRVGASAGLKGSGMCLTKRVVDTLGWNAFGLAEDIEQHVRLLQLGVPVAFARDAVVVGAAPRSLSGAREQHRRWEAGRVAAARRMALPLLADGVRRRSLASIDAGIELLVPPLSILSAVLAVLFLAGVLLGSPVVAAAAGIGGAGLVVYVAAGFALQGLGWRRTLSALTSLPVFAAWKIGVYVQALIWKPRGWEATQRDEREPVAPSALPGGGTDDGS